MLPEVEEGDKALKDILQAIKNQEEAFPLATSTLGNRLQAKILASLYVANMFLLYMSTLWTIRLFQPLKVFQ